MIDFSKVHNYYIACGYTDMRKQIDGLVATIQIQFGKSLDEKSLFYFVVTKQIALKQYIGMVLVISCSINAFEKSVSNGLAINKS